MGKFSAGVSRWTRQQNARINAVFKTASQMVVAQMQELVPVDTGFCRASIQASLTEMPSINGNAYPKINKPGVYKYKPFEIEMTIKGWTPTHTLYIGYTAAYAKKLEYGHSGQAPRGFVRLTAQRWPEIVQQADAEVRRAAGVK